MKIKSYKNTQIKFANNLIILSLSILALSSCVVQHPPILPSPIKTNNHSTEQTDSSTTLEDNHVNQKITATKAYKTPSPQQKKKLSNMVVDKNEPKFKEGKLQLSSENLSLPAFINEVFGNLLGVNFVLDPRLSDKKDRVTLRVTEPQTPEQLYNLTKQVLDKYGIQIIPEENLLRITIITKNQDKEPPLLVSGDTLPDVPLSHRTIFQLVPLKVVRNTLIQTWLSQTYKGTALKLDLDQQRNAIILMGPEHVVKEALRSIAFFDQPYLRGRYSLRIDPAFVTAEELANELTNVLIAQGYAAGRTVAQSGSILVLPVVKANMVLLFAADKDVLEHAKTWAFTLDKTNENSGDKSLFYYEVQNTRADSIAATLNSLISGTGIIDTPSNNNATQATNNQGNGTNKNRQGGNLIVDDARNAILFKGEPSQWERLMPLIIKMDKPTKQVLVEVTIAEVTLSDKEKFGIEWFANGKNGRYNSTISSQPSENIGGVGLNWVLDVAGATKATLNAFAEDSRVNVISTPRLLVKTGETASLDVVTEIPTVVGRVNSNAQSNGNSNVIEEIVYRKTGVILKVEPIIHAGNRVDLKISQEVSEVLPVESGGTANSPALFNRNVETNLSLHSGGSVYLAGLISSRENNGSTGVPLLKDLPWIGNAFKSQSKNTTRTELVITIVPYIITDENDAKDITDSLLSNLNFIKQEKDLTQRPKTPTINPTKK